MRLPWRDGCPKLPNNHKMALSRLKSLGRRLKREPNNLTLYQDKVNEMVQLGHAKRASQDDKDVPSEKTWYIPHHYIEKKFRIVFDCAATCQGTSLNQQLLQGPDNTNSLIGVLLRFRFYSVAIVGDIRNMFHMVKVDPKDQSALRFLWWRDGDPDKSIESYYLTVHTFGLTSSPSIAGYALRRTAHQNLSNASELALSTIQNQFYVDDLLTSVKTSNQAVQLISELDSVLSSGGFTLAKLASNRPEVLETLPRDRLTPQLQVINFHADNLPTHKTLGLIWHASTDQLRVKVAVAEHPRTRRGLLSVLASVYDPFGIVGPYTLPAKLILQQLAKAGLGWDVDIPDEAKSTWNAWLNALPNLDGLSIPRVYVGFENAQNLQLHCFADASKDGFGAVCYLCCNDGEKCSGNFVMELLEVKQARNTLKRYCCVFTCFASRATHLEMAYSLTTESFLMVLRRFLSTRGYSTHTIFCDNGTNFVGARSELQRGLQRLNRQQIIQELSPKGIEWVHAPPLASHQGGIYESIIRLVRKAMDSLLSDRQIRTLTDEGLVTVLKEIEYILNCRPLARVSTSPEDMETLSPIMLLTGSLATGLPPDVFVSSDSMRSSWRACQLQIDQFWKRWQSEYLQLLQRRQKWLMPERNLKKNDLVLIKDEDQPRNFWPKGLVVEVFPDRDGLVRRAKIRLATGKIYLRDIRKLCLLEGDIDDANTTKGD